MISVMSCHFFLLCMFCLFSLGIHTEWLQLDLDCPNVIFAESIEHSYEQKCETLKCHLDHDTPKGFQNTWAYLLAPFFHPKALIGLMLAIQV